MDRSPQIQLSPLEGAITYLNVEAEEMRSSGENLLARIKHMDDRYLVDSNAEWFALSGRQRFSNTAFVLGNTYHGEVHKLQAIFSNPKDGSRKVRRNVFLFGCKYPSAGDVISANVREPYLILVALNQGFGAWADLEAIKRFDAGLKGSPRFDNSDALRSFRSDVLKLLDVQDIEQLKSRYQMRPTDASLQNFIDTQRPHCEDWFWKSDEVAKRAYCRLLIASQKARNAFSRPDNVNVFNDQLLIQNALFLGAKILSKDNGVHEMARFCQVKCVRVLT